MECTIHRNRERNWNQLALTQAAKKRTPDRIDPNKTIKASQWVLLLSLLLVALSNAVHQAHAAATPAPVPAPSAPTTPAPTPMPTLCLSSCPAGQYNKDWLAHLESGTCKESGSLSCLVCPGGFFKTSGNSWTACSACGGPNAYCKSGKRSVRSSALCTYRADVLTKFNADGTLAQSVAVENQEEEQYSEQNVRDSQDTCGTPSVTTPTIDLQVIKPASSVTKVTIANSGTLPLLLHDFILPSWITLFDNTKGSEVSDEAQLSLVVAGKASLDVYLLVKSSDIPSEDLEEADDFDTSGVTVASTSISFESSQVISTPGIASVPLEADVTVEISEPSLSLLPSENTWSISIGSIERRTLALYNMQVKKIDWVAEVVYNSEETTGWLAVSPTSGSLEQGFKCTSGGEVISTNGVNKAEVAVTVDGTSIAPGSYTATIRIKQSANQALFSVTSAVKLEVLPGDVEAQETVFEWEVTQVLTDTTTVLSVSETGEDRRRRLKRQRRLATTVDEEDDDDEEVINEVYLPNTELTILPRDRFGIDTNQFADSDTGNFNVTWWGISAEASDSGTIYISRNPIDNTFVGDLDIRQKGTYMVEITMSGSGEHIKGSPLSLQVHPRICLDTANSESHPVSGYTCVCSAGYGKTADSQACEPCPAGQHRDESMLTVSPYCRSCDLGMYQDETASATCKYCPLGHQPNAEQTACEACQDSYVVDVDSPARNCVPCGSEFTVVDHKCVCKPEFYWADVAKTRCAACPVGAFCGYGDRTTILPLQGYWRANWDPMHFEPCPVPESCLGVTEEDEFILRIPEAWASFVTSPYNETWYVDGTASTTAATSTPAASSFPSNSQQLSHTTGNRRLSRLWGLALASQVGRRTEAATRSSATQDSDTASQSEDGGDSTDDSDVLVLPAVQEMNGCAEGQAGPLCKECAPGYYPLGTGAGCVECDSLGSTVGFFLLSIFAGFGALGYLITRTIRARGAPRRREVMVLKIVLSHLQIIAMTKNFPLEWPPALNGLFQVFDIMSSAGSSALSTHCLVATSAQETNTSSAYPTPTTSANSTELAITEGYGISDWVFLAQSLGYALAPILLGLFFAVWWTYVVPMYYDTSSDALSAREKTIVSSIVLLIVLQPFLTGAGFEFFSCSDDIDGRSFLEAQFTIQCWVGVHRKWIALGSLMLAFYAIGIPFCAGIILYRVVRRSPSGASRYRRNPSVGVGLVGSANSSEGVGVGIAMDCGSNTASSSVDSRQSFCNEVSDNKEVKGAKGLKRSLTSHEPSKRRSVGSVSSLESGETHQTRGSLGSLDPNVHDLKKELAATRRQHEKERLQALNEQHLRYQREREEIDALEKWRPVYGFIYSGYRKECFFWEIVIMTRKALFATISVILRPVGVDIQTYAGLLVLVLAIVLHVHYRPYSMVSKLHFIETLSLGICLLTLMSGLLIYSPNTGTFFKQVNTMVIITSNILFFLYVAFSIRESLRDSARRFYEMSRSVVLRRPTIQHVGSSMRSLRLKSDSRSKRLWMRSKRPESTSSQDEATKHGLVHVSTLGLGALEEGSQEDVLSTAGSLSSTPCSGPPTPSGCTPLTATLVSATASSPTWGIPQSKANTKDLHCMAKKRSSSSCNSLKDDFYGDGADEVSFDEDDVYADYLGEEREEEEEVPMEMTSEAEHFVGISYRLQREAERQHRQGNHAAAARTAMLAASTAIEALRQPETSSVGTRSRPVSLSSAGRPLSGRIEADGPYPRSVRGNSRPNSLTSATSSLVGSLKRRLPSFTQKNADDLHVDADGESFGPPIAAERGTSEKPPSKGVTRELELEVGSGNDDDDDDEEEEIGHDDDEGVEAQLPPKLVVVSAELAKP